jgi:hypothetical protein
MTTKKVPRDSGPSLALFVLSTEQRMQGDGAQIDDMLEQGDLQDALMHALSSELPPMVEKCMAAGARPEAKYFKKDSVLSFVCMEATDSDDFLACLQVAIDERVPDSVLKQAAKNALKGRWRSERAAGYINSILEERMLSKTPGAKVCKGAS